MAVEKLAALLLWYLEDAKRYFVAENLWLLPAALVLMVELYLVMYLWEQRIWVLRQLCASWSRDQEEEEEEEAGKEAEAAPVDPA